MSHFFVNELLIRFCFGAEYALTAATPGDGLNANLVSRSAL